jgi:exodeoxyribonuclease V gamma subunit
MTPNIRPGFVALHSHRCEVLADHLIGWLQAQPLSPLEPEVVLVQSNGMAEWVKIELAQQGGVCAATRLELPSRFLWRTYRQVLGAHRVPLESPLDKLPMTWRLMALLPDCLSDPVFAPVAGFLNGGAQPGQAPDRLLQLASRLADLYDQYQIYRPDWLLDWAAGNDVLRPATGVRPMAEEHRWQAELWRRVLATLNDEQRQTIRPALHARVLAHLQAGKPLEGAVPRRVSVFGMSHMPVQLLEMLAALASHSQVLLAVPNPCQYHWGDIMDGREWLTAERRRHAYRGTALAALPLDQMHLHAPTLLAAWGRQGRDFVRQLDAFDDVQAALKLTQMARLDFFDDASADGPLCLLAQLQRRIRDLEPSNALHPPVPLVPNDSSVVFRTAHSAVRELEVLHDQLLQWFHTPPGEGELQPRDVVVMVPDIESMAPAIHAVFGQYKRSNPRFIPYGVADLGARAVSPLIQAVEWLLTLPQQRSQMSELVGLLEVPALAARFGLPPEGVPTLTRWMTGSGIRWGLSAEHRADMGLDACGDANSVLFGVQRMLMGYACGADPLPLQAAGIQPYAEVGGLDAELAGSLAHLLAVLLDWWQTCKHDAAPAQWAERGRALLQASFKPQDDSDRQALDALDQALTDWVQACDQAEFGLQVPLAVARSAWLKALDMPRLEQRFRAGGVTFCTLMPMRAIPFKVVCLLGMNDGDYPRRSQPADFDLMGLPGLSRPGDRSRREDDRQLMLEALLSARQVLYISWCGRSVRDNTEQPPSVLVSQLRDEIDLLWGPGTAESLTVHHPLQPFSRAYFERGGALQTYAHEWRDAQSHAMPASPPEDLRLAPLESAQGMPIIGLEQLARFLGKPVGAFFRERLQIHWGDEGPELLDEEVFGLNGLDGYLLLDQAWKRLPVGLMPQDLQAHVERVVQGMRQAGVLPLAGVGQLEGQKLSSTLQTMLGVVLRERSVGGELIRVPVEIEHPHVLLQDALGGVLPGPQEGVLLSVTASRVATGRNHANPTARPDKMIPAWLNALAAAAMGTSVACVVVGRDAVVRLPGLDQEQAARQMQLLLDAWAEGMRRPLPLPPALALKWLENPNNTNALRDLYEGTSQRAAEAAKDPALARTYPTLEDVLTAGALEHWAEAVYAPLQQWAATAHVEVYSEAVANVAEDELS